MEHISDHDLERYHLGMVKDEAELAPLEEHLLWCPECVKRAEEAADYVDALRAAIIVGNFDLNWLFFSLSSRWRYNGFGRTCTCAA
jgi:hypothetical protein